MNTLTIDAPAKINLFLKVKGKREDGFHEIETLFERISICDKITISKADQNIEISCSNPNVPIDSRNICYKAAQKFFDKTKINGGVKIHIQKNIPVAAGMAGGSTDAAAVIKGLNQLYDNRLLQPELIDIANAIGSDVTFFLYNTAFAIGTERGNVIKPIQEKKIFYHLIVCPDKEVLAKDVYARYKNFSLNLTRKGCIDTIFRPKNGEKINQEEQGSCFFNDLEEAVQKQEPVVREIRNFLYEQGAFKAMVSGSGPSVFGLFKDMGQALKAKDECVKKLSITSDWYISEAETY
ncbi:MAG: 4-(cytidine 5'-diphospho)-2-C-methyl-D-erythritol kinase [Candidatus Omnitrophica bacterium]|nr:4-(cytidine 5'-diphospho)-2-C-methyl-D-erythritol kinase [Candidatus Omnitrophota bacterium]